MSKWLSVCIFLLLAIACTVDLEPAEPAAPITPAGAAALAGPVALAETVARTAPTAGVAPITHAQTAAPAAAAWDEHADSVSRPGATGDLPRVFVTRDWSQRARHAPAP
jgi:hypothetical protein